MKPRHWSLLALAFGGMLVLGAHATAPEQTSSKTILVRSTVTYADPAEQNLFREALVAASIAHEVSIGADGNEYVSWSGDQDAAVEIVMVRLFGEPLPTGRHIHFGGVYGDQFKAWLTANGIPFRIVIKRGKEYVVWEDQDSPRVAKWEKFPASYWPNPELLKK